MRKSATQMGNILRILKRDVLRLLKAPAAMVVVVALLVLPSIYTWYNVAAFWNPYEATGNLSVNVVNQDLGTETDVTGKLEVGKSVMEALTETDKINFIASDSVDDAVEELKAGHVYAVYVIPEDFSECLVSPLTGKIKSPTIKYYANEKLGPVSPKITDAAATTVDESINSEFVAAVSDAAVKAINAAMDDAEADVLAAQSKASKLVGEAATAIDQVRTKLEELKTAITDAQTAVGNTSASMENAAALTADAQAVIQDVANTANTVQSSLETVSSTAISSISEVLVDVSKATAEASTVADGFVSKAGTAESYVSLATGRLQPIVDDMSALVADLDSVASVLPEGIAKQKVLEVAQDLSDRSTKLQTLIDEATALSAKISEAAEAVSGAAESLQESAQVASDALKSFSDGLFGSAAPTLNAILAEVATVCGNLSGAITSLDTTVDEAMIALEQLDGVLGDCGDAITQTNGLIDDLQVDLDSVTADVNLLSQSNVITELIENGSLNPETISSFMSSPTELETVKFYELNAYGTAMAPLFMNLTFWIGAFMLVIIFRLEVDDEGIKKITLRQRYASRFMLFSFFAAVQAIVCCAGTLLMGVEAANAPALFLAAVLSSLAYLSIIYALSTTLRHIGKALCIILVFAQIPGGSGLYPLELTSDFFQAIYPFLPFSYGIDAMREAIGGFYGSYYIHDLAVLIVIFVAMLLLGMALVPVMSNVTRMVAGQIQDGDLFNGENAVAPARPYRFSQLISALSNREDYREDVERRYEKFSRRYPIFIRVAIVVGIAVPAVLVTLLTLDAGEKVTLLTAMLLWLIALIVFLVIVESMRYSFERQLNIKRMSGENLIQILLNRERVTPASSDAIAAIAGPMAGVGIEIDDFGLEEGTSADSDSAQDDDADNAEGECDNVSGRDSSESPGEQFDASDVDACAEDDILETKEADDA